MIESKSWQSRLFNVANVAILAAIAAAAALPMIHLLAVSLSDRAATQGGRVTLWPIGFTLTSYQKVMESGAFLDSLWVSVQRTVLGTAVMMLLTVITAYPLSKSTRELKGRNIIMWLFVFALLFNGGIIPLFLVIRNLNLLDSLWALILPMALPVWNVILMMNFFRGIPKELEEAALLDGASHWEILRRIYLPLSLPALATLTLFCAVAHWNSWFDGMIYINSPEKQPLQTFLRSVVVNQDLTRVLRDSSSMAQYSNRSLTAAQIYVATVPILVVYPFLQRYFISGIKLGALKG
jgi:putative aldouronate transport system permease protein